MKRQIFRLGSVLRVYELRKQRAEMELQVARRNLNEIEATIAKLSAEIEEVADLLLAGAEHLSTTGWIACYRKTEWLDRQRVEATQRRRQQEELVGKLREERKKWAVAEETLLSLRHGVEKDNRAEAARAQQLQLDETVLRRALEHDSNGTDH